MGGRFACVCVSPEIWNYAESEFSKQGFCVNGMYAISEVWYRFIPDLPLLAGQSTLTTK
jgi:hypothetical protein